MHEPKEKEKAGFLFSDLVLCVIVTGLVLSLIQQFGRVGELQNQVESQRQQLDMIDKLRGFNDSGS